MRFDTKGSVGCVTIGRWAALYLILVCFMCSIQHISGWPAVGKGLRLKRYYAQWRGLRSAHCLSSSSLPLASVRISRYVSYTHTPPSASHSDTCGSILPVSSCPVLRYSGVGLVLRVEGGPPQLCVAPLPGNTRTRATAERPMEQGALHVTTWLAYSLSRRRLMAPCLHAC